MEIQAFAKLNLTLDILGKREDGYHDLRMVMQSITLADTLTLEENQGEGLRVSANLRFLPTGEKNLAAAAALRFWEALGREPEDLDIRIEKRIPVCAGMAGGSSDAAAVLRALNQRAGDPFSPKELARLGERVGSDVPYCVLGGTALAEGRGEVLTPLAPLTALAEAKVRNRITGIVNDAVARTLEEQGISYADLVTVTFELDGAESAPAPTGQQLEITMSGSEGEHTITTTLLDTPAAAGFASHLPLSFSMTDYMGREKHAHMDFSIGDSLLENITVDYEIGDIIYYPPGPTFAMYYDHDGRTIAAGMEVIARMDQDGIGALGSYAGNVDVTVSLAE